MALTVRIECEIKTGVSARVYLAGRLDTLTAPQLEEDLRLLLQGAVRIIAFDLAELQFVSSAGLRIFAATRKTLTDRGGSLAFVNTPPQIQRVLEIMKALPNLRIFKSVKELDDYLAEIQRKVVEGEV